MSLVLTLAAFASFVEITEPPPDPRCRAFGPERAACVQVTPRDLVERPGRRPRMSVREGQLADGRFLRLPLFWLGARGDELRWAAPDLDDGSWPVRPTRQYREDLEAGSEVLWFRLHLEVDLALVDRPLALSMPHSGAAEVFLDGVRIHASGAFEPSPVVTQDGYGEPFRLSFSRPGHHVLAVRWSAAQVLRDRRIRYTPAFRLMLGHWTDLHRYAREFARDRQALILASAAFPLALALLHLCFALFRGRGANLVYASFAASVGWTTALPLTFELVWTWPSLQWAQAGFRAGIAWMVVGTLLLHLHLGGQSRARIRWLGAASVLPVGALAALLPNDAVFFLALVMTVVAVYVLARALHRPAARIHAVGVMGFLAGAAISLLGALDWLEVGPILINAHVAGVPVLLTTMAIALAWEVAATQRAVERQADALARFEEQVASRRELEAAYARLRVTQAELVEVKRSASLVKLVAGLTHELGSPLGALRSSFDLLDRTRHRLEAARSEDEDGRDAERALAAQRSALATADQALARLSALTGRLRTFVQLDEADERRVDLNEGLDAVVELFRSRMEPQIAVETSYGELPRILCRPRALNQAFEELLDNAIEAIEARGGPGRIRLETRVEGGWVDVIVEDDGRGMSEEEQRHLFDTGFKRGARVEMGMGLLTARRTVTAHGGTIEVRSVAGRGTRVRIHLPIEAPTASAGRGAKASLGAETNARPHGRTDGLAARRSDEPRASKTPVSLQ